MKRISAPAIRVFDESGWDLDRLIIRPWRQIEEGPIHIEKKTDLLRPQIHRVQFIDSTVDLPKVKQLFLVSRQFQ